MWHAFVVLVLGSGCLVYKPGSFHATLSPFVGRRVTVGCVELAVARTEDAAATGAVVAYQFGNRCLQPVELDLASIRVVARDPYGGRVLHAFDPRHELRALRLDGWWRGQELIEYLADDRSLAGAICVDVGGIDRGVARTVHWVCLGASDDVPPELAAAADRPAIAVAGAR